MEKQYIFYGAGAYAKDNLKRLIAEGVTPACFADSDTNKHNKIFEETGFRVLSIDDAIAQYPNYELVITVDALFRMEVYEYLRDFGIEHSRISFAEKLKYRKGCTLFEDTIIIRQSLVTSCCRPLTDAPDFFNIPYESGSHKSLENAINKCIENRTALYEKWCKLEKNPCDKCTHLEQRLYESVPKIRTLIFSCGFEGMRCNFRCSYCTIADFLESPEEYAGNLYETIVRLSEIFDLKGMIINFTNGEFTAHKDCDLILDYLYDKGATLSLVSNSSIYKDSIARFIRDDRMVGINTSLDAGTRETFAKVKGVDCYEKVIENILRYSGMGCCYFLKYIVLEGINDNEEDINGFVEVCKQANAREVTISANLLLKPERLSKNSLDMVLMLYNKLTEAENSFKILFSSNCFNIEDWKTIQTYLKTQ